MASIISVVRERTNFIHKILPPSSLTHRMKHPLFFSILLVPFIIIWLGYEANATQMDSILYQKSGGLRPNLLLTGGIIDSLLFALIQRPSINDLVMQVLANLGGDEVIDTRFGCRRSWSLNVL